MRTSFLYPLLSAFILLPCAVHGQGRTDPLRKALDADGDGTISAAEAENAAYVLQFLDEDGDGALGPEELSRRGGTSNGFGSGMGMGMGMGRSRDGASAAEPPSPEDIPAVDGTASLPDRRTFLAMSYERGMVMPHLQGREFVKFQIEEPTSDHPKLYFINTKTHATHIGFMQASGIAGFGRGMRGVLVYRPFLRSGTGGQGMYTFEFEHEDAYSTARILAAHELLTAQSDLLRENLAYHPLGGSLDQYQADPEPFEAMGIPLFLPSEEFLDVGFLPLHQATGYGRLRLMSEGEFPGPRDIVIYPTLPNEMPRVAGVLTMVRQTPLSHVNLRAIQDDIPNAFVAGAATSAAVQDLLGKYVRLTVADSGYVLEQVEAEQVMKFFDGARPQVVSFPERDLSTEDCLALNRIGFEDSARFGVKAANLGALHGMGLPEGCVPHGFAIPFMFYDEFFRSHGFAEVVEGFLGDPAFQRDSAYRKEVLKDFRKRLKQAAMPTHLEAALDDLYGAFPNGTSLRCRSSTNNEDLPGFSGAGLYDSFTHHPEEGSLSKSIKQVYASLWTFRAFEERTFHRIDHFATAMGVVVHPNFERERLNGVAVSEDILYQTGKLSGGRRYYINAQVGEDLVTNPEHSSTPEELLLSPRFPQEDIVVRRSNRTAEGTALLNDEQLAQLRIHLRTIHREFASLFDVEKKQPFAMEIEFKVDRDGVFIIKQARPWVY